MLDGVRWGGSVDIEPEGLITPVANGETCCRAEGIGGGCASDRAGSGHCGDSDASIGAHGCANIGAASCEGNGADGCGRDAGGEAVGRTLTSW